MKQKIKSFISLKATSAMFGLLFFVALAGGVVIDAPSANAAVPVISELTVTPDSGTVKIGSTVVLTITADITGHLESAITVNGVATTSFTDNSDNTYSATYTVIEGNLDVSSGAITASVVLTDSGGINPNTAYTTVIANTLVVDANSPTLISAEFADDVLKIGETSLVTFTFSEEISDFANNDLTIANGTLTTVTDTGAGIIWTATFTPIDNIESATNVITVDMTGVADTATNVGVGSTDSSNYAINTIPVDGELKAENGIVLNDTSGSGMIDNVEISVNYTVAIADAIAHAVDVDTTKGKFTITNVGSETSVGIDSINFISGDSIIAVFELVLDEADVTSATELNVSYDASGSDLKITSGTSESVDVASFSNVTEEDEDDDYITPPEGALPGPATPNPNSGVTLYRMEGSPRVYVIKNKKKHWIQTPKEFNENGYNWGKVKIVSADVLEEYADDGEEEVSTTELLRAIGSHKVYKINNGKRSWIKTAGEFNAAGYKWKDIKDVSLETLTSYQNEVPSELLRATGSYKVYKIENGKKRWIKTAGEFNAAGHRWEDVEDADPEILDSYPNLDE